MIYHFSSYVHWRMRRRGITEVEVRDVIENPIRRRAGRGPGRWVAVGKHAGLVLEVVYEPLGAEDMEVITVYWQ